MRVGVLVSAVGIAVAGLVAAPSAAFGGRAANATVAPPQDLRMSVTAQSGPPGTVITVKSIDPCPPPTADTGTSFEVLFSYAAQGDRALSPQVVLGRFGADGSWNVELTVGAWGPGGRSFSPNLTGPARIEAACGTPGVFGSFWNGQPFETTGVYSSVPFDVTTLGAGYWLPTAMPVPMGCACPSTNVVSAGDAKSYGPYSVTKWPGLVGIAPNPRTGTGYWLAGARGGVFAFGDARSFGSAAGLRLTRPVAGIAARPSGRGYWLVASDGGVFSFGDARFFGSAGGLPLTRPVVGIAATPSGRGYWLVASDGGVFSFGDARFFGSAARQPLARPVVGIAAMPSGRGYWLATADGGVFAFGDARFFGSAARQRLARPVVGMAATVSGRGYWLAAADGRVFTFGDARSYDAPCLEGCGASVVAIARTPVTTATP